MVHIAFVCDESFSVPTLVAAHSVRECAAAWGGTVIHVVTPGLSREAREAFAALQTPSFTVDIVESEAESLRALHSADPDSCAAANHVALLKFRLPGLFPSLDRILYLDGDVLVRGDLSPLWNLDLGGAALAAVRDSGTIYWKHPQAVRHPKYFNSGVMLFDLAKMRSIGAEKRLFAAKRTLREAGSSAFVDQNIFNEVFDGDVRCVSIFWNCLLVNLKRAEEKWCAADIAEMYGERVRDWDDLVSRTVVWHFSSRDKPWGDLDVPGKAEWQAAKARLVAALRARGVSLPAQNIEPRQVQNAQVEMKRGVVNRREENLVHLALRSAILPPLRAWRRVFGAYHAFMIEDRIAQLDRATDEVRRLRAAADGLRSECASLRKICDEQRKQYASLRSSVESLRQDLTRASSRISDLEPLRQNCAALRQNCAEQRAMIGDVRLELRKVRERLSDLEPLRRETHFQGINRDKIACEIELASGRPGTTSAGANRDARIVRDSEVVVTLTTYPARVYDVHFTLHSLLSQSIPPDRVVLWLSEEEFSRRESDLPRAILDLRSRGLEIRYVPGNARAYKKLLPALEAFPDAIVVTADDDIYYPSSWLETLLSAHSQDQKAIWATRARRVVPRSPYFDWPLFDSPARPGAPGAAFPTGAGGILYPPHALDARVRDALTAQRLAPTNDDIWFWAMGALCGTSVGVCPEAMQTLVFVNPRREARNTDDGRLMDANLTANDSQIEAVMSAFPELREMAGQPEEIR